MAHRAERDYSDNRSRNHNDRAYDRDSSCEWQDEESDDYMQREQRDNEDSDYKRSKGYERDKKERKVKSEPFKVHKEEDLWRLPWDEVGGGIYTVLKIQGIFENEDPKTREERRKKHSRNNVEDSKEKESKDEDVKDNKNQESKEDNDRNAKNNSSKEEDGKEDKAKKSDGQKERHVAFRLRIYQNGNNYNGILQAVHIKQQKYIESYSLVNLEWQNNSRLLAVFELNDDDKENCKDKIPEYLTVTAITRMYDEAEPQVHIYTPGICEKEIKWGGHLVCGEISSACKDIENYIDYDDECCKYSDANLKMLYCVKINYIKTILKV